MGRIKRPDMTTRTQEEVDATLDVILNIPIHRFINLKFESFDNGAKAYIIVSENHLTPNKTMHGGITSSCLDVICFIASLNVLTPSESAATIASSVQLLSTAYKGQRITFTGRVIRRTKRLLFCESEATSEGKVLARAQLTKQVVSLKSSL